VAGDGKIYLLSETGEAIVLRASKELEILARNTLDARFLASPAVSNGQIFLRSDDRLFCVGKSTAPTTSSEN
jgi:outer membrane protein assembly factor BamB